jgi:hypothetical protein
VIAAERFTTDLQHEPPATLSIILLDENHSRAGYARLTLSRIFDQELGQTPSRVLEVAWIQVEEAHRRSGAIRVLLCKVLEHALFWLQGDLATWLLASTNHPSLTRFLVSNNVFSRQGMSPFTETPYYLAERQGLLRLRESVCQSVTDVTDIRWL